MAIVYHIPFGTKNINKIFPHVDLRNVQEYYLEAIAGDDTVIATTTINSICPCSEDEKVRLHFLNYAGDFDAINFEKPVIKHDDEADTYQKPLTWPLEKTSGSTQRFNVRANDTYEARHRCKEEDMKWLQECADSPIHFMEWPGAEGQPASYIPVVKVSGGFTKLKNVQEYEYEFVMSFQLSNDIITIRN